jgi:dipeptidyl aminopeptidase/acylaminoacyl peptidase
MRGMMPDDLYAIHWISDVAMHPDSDRVAFVTSRMDRELDEYRSPIWVVDVAGGAPRQFTSGERRDRSPRWSPDGRWLAFTSVRDDAKEAQLYVMAADGGEGQRLTDVERGAPFGLNGLVWAPDSERIAFVAKTGERPDPEAKTKPHRRIETLKYKMNGEGFTYDRRRHLFVVAREDGEPQQLTDGAWDDGAPAWAPDGAQIAFTSARHEGAEFDVLNDLWTVPAEGGEAIRLTATEGQYSLPAWSANGELIACVFTAQYPGNRTLHVVEASTGERRAVDAAFDRQTGGDALTGEGAAPMWLPDGRLLCVAQERGKGWPLIASLGSETQWLPQGPCVVGSVSLAADGKTAAAVVSSQDRPAEVQLLDLSSGTMRPLTEMNAGWSGEVATPAAEHLVVKRGDGVELDAWLMEPLGREEGKRYPVLLNVHGGPFSQYGEGFFDEFQVFAAAGYGVVFCNPRGSSGQSSEFARSVIGAMGEVDFDDVMASFEAALEQMPWADQSRLGIIGGSYGGFMTSWTIGHTDRFAAACSERAVNDWYLMQGTSDIGGYFNQMYLGERATTYDDLDAVLRQSPITYAGEVTTPVLILHSEDDLRCPISQAEQYYVVLRKLGKESEFIRFPEENHELSRSGTPSHRVDRFELILDWFGRKLG